MINELSGAEATLLTLFIFAHAINRYSYRVEKFSIHLHRNHMAFRMNNTHAHTKYTNEKISNPMRRLSIQKCISNFITCVAIVATCGWINMLPIMDYLMTEMLNWVPRTRTIATDYSAETFYFNFIIFGHFYFIKGTFSNACHSIWLTLRSSCVYLSGSFMCLSTPFAVLWLLICIQILIFLRELYF